MEQLILDKQKRNEGSFEVTCDFLFYNGLKAALPSTWLEKIHAANSVHKKILESDKLLSLMFKHKQMDL